jgi:lysozyme
MQTSAQAEVALEAEEGVVLRAYRCPAGVWTIGAGLTSASGVVKVKAGMVITRAEARRLLQEALRRNYEPRVKAAMPAAKQHEFDAGVLFDYNTGAIHRASWVKLWLKKAGRAAIWGKFSIWNKGGGKVLPGLVKRREREFAILMDGLYPGKAPDADGIKPRLKDQFAVWGVRMSDEERALALAGFAQLGYAIEGQTIAASVVRDFQRRHGLTDDAIIGRATLSTLQRRLDAKKAAVPTAAAPVAASTGSATGAFDLSGFAWADQAALAGSALFAAWVIWRYRDVIAAKVDARLPKLARILRSV